jgi:dsRNA-specific ribonuclease
MVSNRALYNLAQQLHLERYVALNAEFMASPLYMSQWGGVCGVDILCDAVEALIGAINQDQGYEAARRFVMGLLEVCIPSRPTPLASTI